MNPKTFLPRPCAECGTLFPPKTEASVYCSVKCGQRAWARKKRAALRAETKPAPALPWASDELCQAVKVGMAAPSAVKCGRFIVLRAGMGSSRPKFHVHVPTEALGFPRENIVLFAALNDRRRWKLVPVAKEAA